MVFPILIAFVPLKDRILQVHSERSKPKLLVQQTMAHHGLGDVLGLGWLIEHLLLL